MHPWLLEVDFHASGIICKTFPLVDHCSTPKDISLPTLCKLSSAGPWTSLKLPQVHRQVLARPFESESTLASSS